MPKLLGRPVDAPHWYRERPSSWIEKKFVEEAEELAELLEAEHWFGDTEKHHRFRVDFLLQDARIIVELDGYEYHYTKEQLTKDAMRQRYLTHAGYSVVRFTGREIFKDTKACVEEVHQIYTERMQHRPVKHRALYVDCAFALREAYKAQSFVSSLSPHRDFEIPSVDTIVLEALEWLHERSFVTVFLFISDEDVTDVEHLNQTVREYEKGEVRFTVVSDSFYSSELYNHLEARSHLFDQVSVIADDQIYIAPLLELLDHTGDRLIRRSNDETAYLGTDLVQCRWQDIYYVVTRSMGAQPHEI